MCHYSFKFSCFSKISLSHFVWVEYYNEFIRNILCRLSESERGILIASLSDRVDPRVSHLYIRLSKQDAYLGRIKLLDGSDVIKIVFSFTSLKSVDSLRNVLEEMIKSC